MKYVKKSDGTLISSECDTIKVTENTLKKLLDTTKSMDHFFYNSDNNVFPNEYRKKITQALTLFQYNDTENVINFNSLFFAGNYGDGGAGTLSINIPFVIGGKVLNLHTKQLFYAFKLDGIDFDITLKNTANYAFDWQYMFYRCILINFKRPIRIIYESSSNEFNERCAIFDGIGESQPDIDWENMFIFESITNLNGLFYGIGVKNFKMPPANLLDTSKVKCTAGAFRSNYTNIIPAYDFSSVTNAENMCRYASYLKEFLPTGLKVSFDLSSSTQFERENLVTVLNNLGTPTTTQTLTIGSTNLAKLTEEDIAIATQKNWTLK